MATPDTTKKPGVETPNNTVKVGMDMDKETHGEFRILCFRKGWKMGEGMGKIIGGFMALPPKDQEKILTQ